MRDFLQGKWLRQPLHPLLVHLPIGLFVLGFLFDVISYLADWELLVPAAFWVIVVGIVAGLLAAVPGVADYSSIRRDAEARSVGRKHMLLNGVALVLFGVSALLRYPELEATQPPLWAFFFGLSGMVFLSYSGYLGGELVYDDGVGVGRHRRHTPLPDATIERQGDGGAFVEVAAVDSIRPGETHRARVNGTVLVLANVGGFIQAFQEFCPHRYGPLSEGRLIDGQIECPWHRSCFDVQNGKVTKGPSKVDLKIFPVRVRDGKVEVQV